MHSILLVLLLAAAKPKPVVQTDSAVVRQIAEYILNEYRTGYKSGKDGKLYDDPRDIPPDEEIRLVTNYAAWNYTTGIMNSALLEYAAYSGESKFADFPPKHVAYALQEWNKVRPSVTPTGDWHPFYGLRRFDELDFMGPECGALMDLCDWFGENEEYEAGLCLNGKHERCRGEGSC